MVESFVRQAVAAGHGLESAGIQQIVDYFCARKKCSRKQVSPALELDVTGIGKVLVQSWEEPADVVENFIGQAVAAGHPVNLEGLNQIMEFFCTRMLCNRRPSRTFLAQAAAASAYSATQSRKTEVNPKSKLELAMESGDDVDEFIDLDDE